MRGGEAGVVSSVQPHEALGFMRRGKNLLRLDEGNHLVIRTVGLQQRHVNAGHAGQGVEPLAEKPAQGNPGEHCARHVFRAGEGAFQDYTAHGTVHCQSSSHRRAERSPVRDHRQVRRRGATDRVVEGRAGAGIQARLARPALAFSVTRIFGEQHIHTAAMPSGREIREIADVFRVPVEENHRTARRITRNPPRMRPDAPGQRNHRLLESQPGVRGRPPIGAGRMIELNLLDPSNAEVEERPRGDRAQDHPRPKPAIHWLPLCNFRPLTGPMN